MRARYTIFPRAGYVLETFCGAVTFLRYVDFVLQQHEDVRIAAHYHTVSDFTQATLRLSIAEVEKIASLACQSLQARSGKRALVVSGSRNLVFADLFSASAEQANVVSRCFGYRDAALRWITISQGDEEGMANESFGIFR